MVFELDDESKLFQGVELEVAKQVRGWLETAVPLEMLSSDPADALKDLGVGRDASLRLLHGNHDILPRSLVIALGMDLETGLEPLGEVIDKGEEGGLAAFHLL